MNEVRSPLTGPEIRHYFIVALQELDQANLNYIEFYGWLRTKGLRPKGGTRKECHRSIYNALTNRKDFVKVAPGVFAESKNVEF
jgi:hypothetical protein